MTNVTMKATDTLHISAVKSDSIQRDEEFVTSTSIADDLEKRGLAVRVAEAPEADAPAEAPADKAVSGANVPAKPGKAK